jgi:GMP synthase (glutamine-hydrolysing)
MKKKTYRKPVDSAGQRKTAKKPAAPAFSRPNVSELVIVLDFGAQYGQLIARRVRESRVYCEILPFDTPVEKILALRPKGIIFSGGPASVYEKNAPECDPAIFKAGIPILGICYGMQLMGKMLGGKVSRAGKREFGKTELTVLSDADLFTGLNPQLICWMSHGDQVKAVPPGFIPLAKTRTAPIAAMAHRERRLYGVQFHPEVIHTPWGIEIFRNFLYQICGCQGLWTMASVAEQAAAQIRQEVGKQRVICALSGGVDSCTTAAIVHRAIGDQLTCIFVDHGFLRKNEAKQVVRAFKDNFRVNLLFRDASRRFLKRLEGITDPEQKRIRIGNEFVSVFEEEAKKIGRVSYLAQGTLYPDVIESGTRTAAGIKSHHNVAGLPERMKLKLIEPLRSLFKDEVRRLAEELGLPAAIAWRHPFPGPGLAIRILGEVNKERLDMLREADAVCLDEIRKAGLYRHLFQAFAVLAPSLRSVGVMGDQRTYAYTLILRAVTGDDAMTADWARLPTEVLERISGRVINEVRGVNRVVYDISSKPPATIEWE